MRVPSYHRHSQAATINEAMTPMIDVVFLLLIFFVCASVGQTDEAVLPTELASGNVATTQPVPKPDQLDPLWIELMFEGDHTEVILNGTRHPDIGRLREILAALRQAEAAGQMPVVLDVAANVPMGDALAVYDDCLATGFASIDFAVGGSGGGG